MDPKVEQIGKKVTPGPLFNRYESLSRFTERVNDLDVYAKSLGVRLLIENNVVSAGNYHAFGCDPFLMTTAEECKKVMEQTSENVALLVDLAHLKVSARSLNFDPITFLREIDVWVEGYHLSENDGTRDSNEPISEASWFWPYVKRSLSYYSIEVYGVTPSDLLMQCQLVNHCLGVKTNDLT